MMAALYQRLSATVSEMPPASVEAHIAQIMLDNIRQIYDLSIGEVAKLCNVSKSTVSKFVRFLGFEDYMDFKAEAVRQREKEVYFQNGNTINITDYILENGVESYKQSLFSDIENLFSNIDQNKIDQLTTLLFQKKKIAAFGAMYSETAAMNLQNKMSYYQKFIYTTMNDRKQEEYIRSADEDTLLLIFSNSGRYITMYPSLEGTPKKTCFDKTKAYVVLFTSNPEMAKDPRVDLCIVWSYNQKVQNHPILYQLLIEQIALSYQQKFGFPMEKSESLSHLS